ncbi:extracellular solute-binding protein [Aeromicrobium sp. CF4.19]|uniref:extracellular solute-binding protein n=1 Tax=Aeromicrobium sp. CF4.19 TaxID=3373082 RepID=UPI003EE74BE2
MSRNDYPTHRPRPAAPTRGAVALITLATLLAGCGSSTPSTAAPDPVSVLYAGSLAAVVENGLGPAYSEAESASYEGEAHGSLGAAQMIRDRLRAPDVFISADPEVNEEVLMGPANDDLVSWYVTFASSQLVIGYSPSGPHAEDFAAAEDDPNAWYELLMRDDIRFGRGDPTIDPKGYRTLFLFELAARHYGEPKIAELLGDDINPDQVLPEVSLLARVDSGQFDAGIFYRHEAVAAGLPYVTLPPEINLGDPAHADDYATTSYTNPDGVVVTGAPILFTITIPEVAEDPERGESFLRFVLTEPDLLAESGFGNIELRFTGDADRAPTWLTDLTPDAGP